MNNEINVEELNSTLVVLNDKIDSIKNELSNSKNSSLHDDDRAIFDNVKGYWAYEKSKGMIVLNMKEDLALSYDEALEMNREYVKKEVQVECDKG